MSSSDRPTTAMRGREAHYLGEMVGWLPGPPGLRLRAGKGCPEPRGLVASQPGVERSPAHSPAGGPVPLASGLHPTRKTETPLLRQSLGLEGGAQPPATQTVGRDRKADARRWELCSASRPSPACPGALPGEEETNTLDHRPGTSPVTRRVGSRSPQQGLLVWAAASLTPLPTPTAVGRLGLQVPVTSLG